MARLPPIHETITLNQRRPQERKDHIPRTFINTLPTSPKHKLLNPPSPPPPPAAAAPPKSNLWKISREFEETLKVYEPETPTITEESATTTYQFSQQEQQQYIQPYITTQPQNELIDEMAQQEETVSIGFDGQYRHMNSLNNNSVQDATEHGAMTMIHAMTTNNETPVTPLTGFYAPEAGGMYTHHGLQDPDDTAAGTGGSGSSTGKEDWDRESEMEYEQPRAVPYNHRETRMVIKEDIDFFMALLGGSENPPPATAETQQFVRAETEEKKRSLEMSNRQSSMRREEELVTTQSDLEFWNMLMQGS